MKTAKLLMTGALAIALGVNSAATTLAVDGAGKPAATTPGATNPETKKVSLNVNVHVTLKGEPRVLTVGVYENVEAGTKVTLEHVKEVLKQYGFEAAKLEGFPAVLDKDYTVDVDAISTREPKKDEPKADEPKKDEPKADEPKKDEPKKDEPKADAPKGGKTTPTAPHNGKRLPKTSAVK